MKNTTTIWEQDFPSQFSEILVSINDPDTMRAFLRDVMTEREIVEISARFRAAQMLRDRNTYTQIMKETKLSSRTVARISDWMQNGTGGYALILEAGHFHMLPV